MAMIGVPMSSPARSMPVVHPLADLVVPTVAIVERSGEIGVETDGVQRVGDVERAMRGRGGCDGHTPSTRRSNASTRRLLAGRFEDTQQRWVEEGALVVRRLSGSGSFLSSRLIGCQIDVESRCGRTSSTTQRAVTQHHGQMGSIQNWTGNAMSGCARISVSSHVRRVLLRVRRCSSTMFAVTVRRSQMADG